ncbi:aminoacyl-tRNA hydrolase [Sandaracinomonas limnophila]|uniref:Peptidyl-tRNA hydrolase n=1 Tax=Sandaracinomonas limnophila TaxID=1862386 RepID=A0A437PW54_9BACT|nr:aminoacyl-tRNA hydrolase [Sandaracinomonas limnophila]RVU26470.1 aminoacyl-tRNA hydrolase [Sandaracinomonas limnophila]
MNYLIVGLGNIGPEYLFTRHNIGFMALDYLAKFKEIQFKVDRLGSVSSFKLKGHTIHLLKPSTFMNLSGKALNYWMQQLKIPKEQVLILVDDLALPFETLRLKPKGSSGGHNGLKNIEAVLGTQDYPRLRMGIGDQFAKGKQIDYVLGNFSDKEIELLPFILDKTILFIETFCLEGIQQTMNKFNQ